MPSNQGCTEESGRPHILR